MKKFFSSILFLIFIGCHDNSPKGNGYASQKNKTEIQDNLSSDTITSQVMDNTELETAKDETIEDFFNE